MTIPDNLSNLTRRDLLRSAGYAIATAAIPFKTLAASNPEPTVSPMMTTLSDYMSAAGERPLPENVVEAAKQHILDTIASMVSGSELPPGHAAIRFARSYGGEKVATVVASNVLCGPIEAALANGVLAHADETDDSHAASETHPGSSIVPATLAMGERVGIDGTDFIRAVTLVLRSNRRESRRGSVTRITSRRDSFLPARPRAAE